jgi:hypothetical protein
MKNRKGIFLILVMVALLLALTACGSDSKDVPSLAATPTAVAADEVLNNEAIMMEYVECLRDEGVEVMDPVVNSDGFVEKPEFVEGFEASKEELGAAMEACVGILDGFTFEGKSEDKSDQLDQYLELVACLREEGFDVDEPTASTFEIWIEDFKRSFDWDDPDTMEAYETCSGTKGGAVGGKGK